MTQILSPDEIKEEENWNKLWEIYKVKRDQPKLTIVEDQKKLEERKKVWEELFIGADTMTQKEWDAEYRSICFLGGKK